MRIIVSQMRTDRAYFAAVKISLEAKCSGSVSKLPVISWGPRFYIVESQPKLLLGAQDVRVIDVTDLVTAKELALFAHSTTNYDDLVEAIIQQNGVVSALVIYPDEGHTSVLLESGGEKWVRDAVLPVRISPGTPQDFQNLDERLMDELERHVDSGGSIGI